MKIEGLPAEVISTLGKAVDQAEDWHCAVAAAVEIQRLPEAERGARMTQFVDTLAARSAEVEASTGARTAFDAVRCQQRTLRRRR